MGKCMLKFFSDQDVERMRVATFKILEDVGVLISHEEAKRMLKAAGAKVEESTDLVRIPHELAEDCMARLPRKIVFGGRTPEDDIILEATTEMLYNRPFSGADNYVDLSDGSYRKVCRSDVSDWAILVDGLEYIDMVSFPFVSESNTSVTDVRGFEITLENCRKNIGVQTLGPRNLEYMVQMAMAERGSEKEARERIVEG